MMRVTWALSCCCDDGADCCCPISHGLLSTIRDLGIIDLHIRPFCCSHLCAMMMEMPAFMRFQSGAAGSGGWPKGHYCLLAVGGAMEGRRIWMGRTHLSTIAGDERLPDGFGTGFRGSSAATGCGWIGSLVWFDGGRLDLELKLERTLESIGHWLLSTDVAMDGDERRLLTVSENGEGKQIGGKGLNDDRSRWAGSRINPLPPFVWMGPIDRSDPRRSWVGRQPL
ncbi:hypothetical protein ACLOJK_027519 [Asimina triloba]